MEDATRLGIVRATFLAAGAALVLCLPSVGRADESADPSGQELLAEARLAASQDRHTDALDLAREALEKDPSLEQEAALLIANQLTWLDRAEEAIPWYGKHLERDFDDHEALLGLARALSWSGELLGAGAMYAWLAEREPSDARAVLGLAQVRSWMEDHGEAARLYATALEIEPDSREAVLGLAAAENARGRHRRAAAIYEELLAEDAEDAQARAGLARAWYWQGRPDVGESLVRGVEGDDADDLRRELRSNRTAVWEASSSFWTDVDDEELTTYALRTEGAPVSRLRIRGQLAFDRSRRPGSEELRAVRATAGASCAASRTFDLNINVTALSQDSNGRDIDVGGGVVIPASDVDTVRPLWDGWATWRPIDWTRLDAGFARTHIATPRALARRIHVDGISLGVDHRFTDRWIVRAQVRHGTYSDGNGRWTATGELDLTPWPWRPVGFTAGASWFAFDETFDHGYYNPERYDTVFVRVRAGWRPGPAWRLAGDARLASEREDGQGRFGVLDGGVELRWRPWSAFGLSAFARNSTSRFDTSEGYERRGAGVALVFDQ